jgi:ATP-dependent RNA helicase DeaD
VRRVDKLAALGRILDLEDGAATLVFARTRGEVDDLAEALSARGRDAAALHGGLAQEQRDRIMGRFRDGALDVLVATDVAARGLDIEKVTHVVNYDVPSSPDTYVHRIGRTGRAGREGVAITLVEPREHRLLRDIERTIGASLEIAGLPTVADLREKRMDLLRSSLRDALVGGGHERYRAVIEPLEAEFDLGAIALAAIAQADAEARGAEDTTELAPAMLPGAYPQHAQYGRGPVRGAGRRPSFPSEHAPVRPPYNRPADWAPQGPGVRFERPGPDGGGYAQPSPGQVTDGRPIPARPGPFRNAVPARAPTPAGPRKGFRPSGWQDNDGRPILRAPNRGSGGGGITRLFVGAGRAAGVGPGDLVGAITHEAGLDGRDIGAIQIADGFSLVEVPEAAVERVIGALRGATIRGRTVMVRRERY